MFFCIPEDIQFQHTGSRRRSAQTGRACTGTADTTVPSSGRPQCETDPGTHTPDMAPSDIWAREINTKTFVQQQKSTSHLKQTYPVTEILNLA